MLLTSVSPNALLWTGTVYNRYQETYRGDFSNERIYRGAQIGSPSGYSSLGDAVRAAKHLSADQGTGVRSGIAVVADGARFLTYLANSRERSYTGTLEPRVPLALGEEQLDNGAPFRDLGTTVSTHAALRALVDGAHVEFVGDWRSR